MHSIRETADYTSPYYLIFYFTHGGVEALSNNQQLVSTVLVVLLASLYMRLFKRLINLYKSGNTMLSNTVKFTIHPNLNHKPF